MTQIEWTKTGGKTHRVVFWEPVVSGLLVSGLTQMLGMGGLTAAQNAYLSERPYQGTAGVLCSTAGSAASRL